MHPALMVRAPSIPHLAELVLLGAAALVLGLVAQALNSHRFAGAAAPMPVSAVRLASDQPVAPPPVVAERLARVAVPALPRPQRRARPHRKPPAPVTAPLVAAPLPVVATPTPAPAPAPVRVPPVAAPRVPAVAKPPAAPVRGPSFDSSG